MSTNQIKNNLYDTTLELSPKEKDHSNNILSDINTKDKNGTEKDIDLLCGHKTFAEYWNSLPLEVKQENARIIEKNSLMGQVYRNGVRDNTLYGHD